MKHELLEELVFNIQSDKDFEVAALAVFQFQSLHNEVYKKYINILGIKPENVKTINEIPFLPIDFFKKYEVMCGKYVPEQVFTSSGTSSTINSRHFIKKTDIYIRSFLAGFQKFYGSEKDYTFICLLPSYLERNGSSLIYMMNYLVSTSHNPQSGFYKNIDNNFIELLKSLQLNSAHKVILLGVSFALLDFAEQHKINLSNFIIMETGGMKGRRKELIRAELHQILKNKFHVQSIHSEYGMTEMLSQAYSKKDGIFFTPNHLKVLIRDMNDPFTLLKEGQSGVINIIDLANIYSCSFIATQDAGRMVTPHSFEVLGRTDNSDIRGCNLMVL